MRKASLIVAALAVAGLGSVAAEAQSVASAYTSGYRWDAARRLAGQISAPADAAAPGAGSYLAVRYSYDGRGQLTRVEKGTLSAWAAESVAPAGWAGFTVTQQTDLTYDVVGDKILEKVSAGGTSYGVSQTSYDGDDRPVCTMVRMALR